MFRHHDGIEMLLLLCCACTERHQRGQLSELGVKDSRVSTQGGGKHSSKIFITVYTRVSYTRAFVHIHANRTLEYTVPFFQAPFLTKNSRTAAASSSSSTTTILTMHSAPQQSSHLSHNTAAKEEYPVSLYSATLRMVRCVQNSCAMAKEKNLTPFETFLIII